MKRSPTAIPRTQEEIRRWLEGLLSKQYDTEETAVHAVEEYRDLVVAALTDEAKRLTERSGTGTDPEFAHMANGILRALAASLGGPVR